ncbi:hypothetical protein [Aurantimonas endophytica]|uniref:Uncharacterized protein n=1 Tax=Aurantimonas endophytica TaxID=1522175 RepID=A0A7W6HCH6_9HYPH|nr:hypothetical protein [Aurantimonas endophytica]MBB4002636.1 hypothetical protein [Aurantimonas endophytica]MCO6403516.1 hypothetical protein [Aurantimonas endophytica]
MKRIAANDDVPVFDRAHEAPKISSGDDSGEWSPPARRLSIPGLVVRLPGDGPTIEHRLKAQAAWITSSRYSGQAANDNQDWPLAKLLRAEGDEHHLRLAERYREMHEAAHAVTDLIGRDASEGLYTAHRTDIDASSGKLVDKGVRKVGKAARAEAHRGLRTEPSHPRPMSKPIPKPWEGDAVLIRQIDAQRELAQAQKALGPLCVAFEAAVVGNDTLEEIGRAHGAGNKTGAKGAGRALVFLGFHELEHHCHRLRIAA